MLYQRILLADGSHVGQPGPLPPELQGLSDASLANLNWADPALGYHGFGFLPPSPTIISHLDMLRRFTQAERIAIRASTDAGVIDIMDMMAKAEAVDLTNSDTINGVNYLASKALITAARATAILTP